MRPTLIVYAHPETFRILSEGCGRFDGTRRSFRDRLYAAWLVFTGRADALMWPEDNALTVSSTAQAAPDGLANLRAIVADQPFQNSGLSVHEINLILANEGGVMPDEAVMWFRASRGTFGTSPVPSTGRATPSSGHGCKRAGGFVDSGCNALCDCHITLALPASSVPSTPRECGLCGGPLPCLTHSQGLAASSTD